MVDDVVVVLDVVDVVVVVAAAGLIVMRVWSLPTVRLPARSMLNTR